MNVFVYGTLKKGCYNHYILNNSEFLFKATTLDRHYEMVDLGSFPAVVKDGESFNRERYSIDGEVYSVDDRTLQSIDYLEGNGSFYNREEVFVRPDNIELQTQSAWIYIYLNETFRNRKLSPAVAQVKTWREWGQ